MTDPRNRPLLRQDRWDYAAYLFKSAVPWVVFVIFALAGFNLARADVLELREHETAVAEVYYHNSAEQNSTGGTRDLHLGSITVVAAIQLGAGDCPGCERIVVTPPADLIAVPDTADVADGASFSILIVRPAF